MHEQITAAEYDSWSEEQCAGIEIVDGIVVVSPSASKRHNRLARILANALDTAAGPDWNADTDWRIEQAVNGVPLIYTYILDPATGSYRTGEMFTGTVDIAAPFPVKVELSGI